MTDERNANSRDEDVRLLERQVVRLEGLLRIHRWALIGALTLVAVMVVLLFVAKAPPVARAILIDGKPVVLVRNEKAAAAVRQRLLAGAASKGGRVTFRESWEDATRPTEGERVLSVNEAVQVLKDKVTVLAEAFAIEQGGVRLAVVPTREMAQTVLDRLKAKYASPSDAVVRMTRLNPAPTVRACAAAPSGIVTDEEEAISQLTAARRPQTYLVVAGDYPDRIAAAHRMSLEDFWRLNAGLKGKTLHPGQPVQVYGREGGLTVVTIKETVTTMAMPAGQRKQPTETLPRGQTRVAEAGRPGSKRVRWEVTMNNDREVARRPLGEEIIIEPKPQLLLAGTK